MTAGLSVFWVSHGCETIEKRSGVQIEKEGDSHRRSVLSYIDKQYNANMLWKVSFDDRFVSHL